MMMFVADVRFIPIPPALVEIMNTSTSGLLLNLSILFCLS